MQSIIWRNAPKQIKQKPASPLDLYGNNYQPSGKSISKPGNGKHFFFLGEEIMNTVKLTCTEGIKMFLQF